MQISSSVRIVAFVLLFAGLAAGCAKKTDTTTADSTKAKTDTTAALPLAIIAADASPDFPNAKLTIVSPREGQVLEKATDSVAVIMNVTGMDLGTPTSGDSARGIAYSKQGQHVHVIVDDKPYMADYKNGQPFIIGVLAPGKHTIRAFPSRSYHESVKSPGAFATRTFYVGQGPAKGAKDTTGANMNAPMLTYSRPKGTYSAAEATKLLLDFYVSNATLAPDGYKVNVNIDGKDVMVISAWKAYYIVGLGSGKHTIALKLLDAKGNVVPGAYNSPSQQIEVK